MLSRLLRCLSLQNKVDLFAERLKSVPLRDVFPEYNGDPADVNSALDFLQSHFEQVALDRQRRVYSKRVSLIDSEDAKKTFVWITEKLVVNFWSGQNWVL